MYAVAEAPITRAPGIGKDRVNRWLLLYSALLVVLAVSAWAASAFTHHYLIFRPLFVTVKEENNRKVLLRYEDLLSFMDKTRHPLGKGETIFADRPEMNYPAPAVFVYSLFANLPIDPATGFVIILSAAAIAGMGMLGRRMVRTHIPRSTVWIFGIVSVVTSYPLLFELDRGNVEGVMWILVMIAMALFVRRHFMAFAIVLAIAGSIKPFPLCLLLLLLYTGRLKEIAVAAAAWVGVTISCFALTGPTLIRSFQAFRYGTQVYSDVIASAYRPDEMNIDHSALSVVKQLVRAGMHWSHVWKLNPILDKLYQPYIVIGGLVCLLCALALWRAPVLNQILGLSTLMVVMPPASYDYTLLYLYIPWALFALFLCSDVANGNASPSPKAIWAVLVCFAVVFTAQTFMRTQWTGFGGQFKCLFLLGLLGASLLVPMPCSLLERTRFRGEVLKFKFEC